MRLVIIGKRSQGAACERVKGDGSSTVIGFETRVNLAVKVAVSQLARSPSTCSHIWIRLLPSFSALLRLERFKQDRGLKTAKGMHVLKVHCVFSRGIQYRTLIPWK